MTIKYPLLWLAICSIGTASAAEPQDTTAWRDAQLHTVVVTGTRTPKLLLNSPVLTEVITASQIAQADATNLQDLLQHILPGVEFSYAMNQQTHMNFAGFGGQSMLVLVDGERLAGETMDDVDFTRLSMDNVDQRRCFGALWFQCQWRRHQYHHQGGRAAFRA